MTIQSWLETAQAKLNSANIPSARLDSWLLLEYSLAKKREWLLGHSNTKLTSNEITKLNKALDQRRARIPLAYITGSKEFYGRSFTVNKAVLIPRPESEAMIELLLGLSPTLRDEPSGSDSNEKTKNWRLKTILDVGTGSGCLAVTAKLELSNATVVATDLSKAALKVARRNASQLGASVQFYEANLLDIPTAIHPDVILANLPYVPDNLITTEEIANEPPEALFSGLDGLDHYRTFWPQLINLPHHPTHVITESLTTQHAELTKLAKTARYKLHKTSTLAQHFTLIK